MQPPYPFIVFGQRRFDFCMMCDQVCVPYVLAFFALLGVLSERFGCFDFSSTT